MSYRLGNLLDSIRNGCVREKGKAFDFPIYQFGINWEKDIVPSGFIGNIFALKIKTTMS